MKKKRRGEGKATEKNGLWMSIQIFDWVRLFALLHLILVRLRQIPS